MLSIRRDIQILIFDNYFLIIFDYVNFPEIDNKYRGYRDTLAKDPCFAREEVQRG